MENYKWVKANVLLISIFLYIPLIIMIVMSFDPRRFMAWPPPSLTSHWYRVVLSDISLIKAFITSITLGILTAVCSSVLGVTIAMAIVREAFFAKDFIKMLMLAPMIIPRVVIGVAILALASFIGVRQGWALLIVGHTLIALPYAILVISSQFYGFNRHLEEAALNLGATPIRTFFEITLPIIMPGIVSGALFAFTVSFQDVEATLAWATPRMSTVALSVYKLIIQDLSPRINVVGVLMLTISILVGFSGVAIRYKRRLAQ